VAYASHVGCVGVDSRRHAFNRKLFFLFTRQKTEDASLKTFGLAVAIVLWVAAAVILGAGIVSMTCCRHDGWGKMGMMKNQECYPGMKPMLCAPGMNAMPCAPGTLQQPQAAPAKEEKKK
jgi:hypothetical protein